MVYVGLVNNECADGLEHFTR